MSCAASPRPSCSIRAGMDPWSGVSLVWAARCGWLGLGQPWAGRCCLDVTQQCLAQAMATAALLGYSASGGDCDQP